MISEFNEWFDADYASTSSRNINQSFAHDELCNDRPIIGAYSYAGYGHAVVICGVNENFGSYAFMDPAVGDYCAGVIYNTSGAGLLSTKVADIGLQCKGTVIMLANPA